MRTGLKYDNPSIAHICSYIEYLAQSCKCPKSVRNEISSIRTYMRMAGIPTAPVDSLQVNHALRALDIQVRHIPDQKLPATPHVVYEVVKYMTAQTHGYMLAYSAVLMFQGFLHQSNERSSPFVKITNKEAKEGRTEKATGVEGEGKRERKLKEKKERKERETKD